MEKKTYDGLMGQVGDTVLWETSFKMNQVMHSSDRMLLKQVLMKVRSIYFLYSIWNPS